MKTATFLRNVPVLAGLSDKLLERVAGFGEQWTVTGLSLAAHRRLCPRLEQAQRTFRDARTIVKWPRPKRTSYDAQSNGRGESSSRQIRRAPSARPLPPLSGSRRDQRVPL